MINSFVIPAKACPDGKAGENPVFLKDFIKTNFNYYKIKKMQNMEEVFEKIQEFKQTRKEINREYKDALIMKDNYEEIGEKIKELRDKKKEIENIVQAEMGSRWDELEKAKEDIKTHEQILTDIAMTSLMDGKNINLKDKNNTEYEPTYKIVFKKIN